MLPISSPSAPRFGTATLYFKCEQPSLRSDTRYYSEAMGELGDAQQHLNVPADKFYRSLDGFSTLETRLGQAFDQLSRREDSAGLSGKIETMPLHRSVNWNIPPKVAMSRRWDAASNVSISNEPSSYDTTIAVSFTAHGRQEHTPPNRKEIAAAEGLLEELQQVSQSGEFDRFDVFQNWEA